RRSHVSRPWKRGENQEKDENRQENQVRGFAKNFAKAQAKVDPVHERPESILSQLRDLAVNDLRETLAGSLALRFPLPEHFVHERIDGKNTRPEQQHNQRGNEKYVRRRRGEFVRIKKNGMERFLIGRDVSHDHVDRQHKRNQPREQADGQQESAKKFEAGNGRSREAWSGQAQACEKIRDFIEVVQLAPAALHQLNAPVQAHKQQERVLEIINKVE